MFTRYETQEKVIKSPYTTFNGYRECEIPSQVEIVGDGYLVASGLPYPNGKQVRAIQVLVNILIQMSIPYGLP